MKNIAKFARRLWNDESGQGMAEYVLLIVVVVTVAYLFKEKIRGMVDRKMTEVGGEFDNFKVQTSGGG
jgi:Flp pilus assembly pilin Flp